MCHLHWPFTTSKRSEPESSEVAGSSWRGQCSGGLQLCELPAEAHLCGRGSPRSLPGELPAGVWPSRPAASCPESPHAASREPGPSEGAAGGGSHSGIGSAGAERSGPLSLPRRGAEAATARAERAGWQLRAGTGRAGRGCRCRPPHVPVLKMASAPYRHQYNGAALAQYGCLLPSRGGDKKWLPLPTGLKPDAHTEGALTQRPAAAPLLCSCPCPGVVGQGHTARP